MQFIKLDCVEKFLNIPNSDTIWQLDREMKKQYTLASVCRHAVLQLDAEFTAIGSVFFKEREIELNHDMLDADIKRLESLENKTSSEEANLLSLKNKKQESIFKNSTIQSRSVALNSFIKYSYYKIFLDIYSAGLNRANIEMSEEIKWSHHFFQLNVDKQNGFDIVRSENTIDVLDAINNYSKAFIAQFIPKTLEKFANINSISEMIDMFNGCDSACEGLTSLDKIQKFANSDVVLSIIKEEALVIPQDKTFRDEYEKQIAQQNKQIQEQQNQQPEERQQVNRAEQEKISDEGLEEAIKMIQNDINEKQPEGAKISLQEVKDKIQQMQAEGEQLQAN